MSWLYLYVGFMIIKDKLGFLHFRQKSMMKCIFKGNKITLCFCKSHESTRIGQGSFNFPGAVYTLWLSKDYYMAYNICHIIYGPHKKKLYGPHKTYRYYCGSLYMEMFVGKKEIKFSALKIASYPTRKYLS